MLKYSIMALEDNIADEEKLVRRHKRNKSESSTIIAVEAEMIIEEYELGIDILKQVEGEK